jgi:hypothetical protein
MRGDRKGKPPTAQNVSLLPGELRLGEGQLYNSKRAPRSEWLLEVCVGRLGLETGPLQTGVSAVWAAGHDQNPAEVHEEQGGRQMSKGQTRSHSPPHLGGREERGQAEHVSSH